MTGTLPDGSLVYAIVIVPEENVGTRNAAWQEFERQWPTRYNFLHRKTIRVVSPSGTLFDLDGQP